MWWIHQNPMKKYLKKERKDMICILFLTMIIMWVSILQYKTDPRIWDSQICEEE